jgi:hypothetical protein
VNALRAEVRAYKFGLPIRLKAAGKPPALYSLRLADAEAGRSYCD